MNSGFKATYSTFKLITECPEKTRHILKNSDGSCFILIIKRLFSLRSVITGINLDMFSSIFCDLTVKLKIRKLQNCLQVKTRAAVSAIVDYIVKLKKITVPAITEDCSQAHKLIEHCTDAFMKISVETRLLFLND